MSHQNTWGAGPSILAVIMTITAVASAPGCAPADDATDGTTDTSPSPPCQDDGKEDGVACDPTADAGVDAGSPTDGGMDATDPGTDIEASDDAEVTTDEGAPEECPPPEIPDGTRCDLGCTIYWEFSSGKCLSDCSGMFGNPGTPEQIAAACDLDAN